MKKYLLLAPLLVTALHAELVLDFNAETWFMNWQQDDKPSNNNGPTINHSFDIEQSLAYELGFNLLYNGFQVGISYRSGETSKDTYTNTLNSYLGNISYRNTYAKFGVDYLRSSTTGIAAGYDPSTGNSSLLNFSTDLDIITAYVSPQYLENLFAFGYQYINYTLPQSTYVRFSDATSFQLVAEDMKWSAHLLVAKISNEDRNQQEKINGYISNVFYLLEAGYGLAKAQSNTIDATGYTDVLKNGTAYYYKGALGWTYADEIDETYSYNLDLGYRYAQYVLKTGSSDGLHVYAQSNSTFHGPFFNASINF